MLAGDRLQLLRHRLRDGDIGEAFCAVNAKGDDRLPIEAGEAACFRRAIGDRGNLVQPGLSTTREHDRAIGQLIECRGAREHPYGLLLRPRFATPAGEVDVGGPQLFIHVRGSDAKRH
jgi:hypothetical protein